MINYKIAVLAEHYTDVVTWCKEHKFSSREVIPVYNTQMLEKIYGLELTSVVTLPSFLKLHPNDQKLLFRTVLSRMRL